MSSVTSEKIAPPREKLVKWLARLYRHRLTTTTGGNLSLLDDDGTLYITPSGGDKAIVPAHNVAVRKKGENVFSSGLPPSMEWPLHTAAYEARPDDCRAVLHAHSMTLVAFSLAHNDDAEVSSGISSDERKGASSSLQNRKTVDRRIPDTRCLLSAWLSCGDVALAPYCIPGSIELAQGCAAALKTGANCVILRNHGVVTIGKSLHEAYDRFVSLEYLARSIVHADSIGKPLKCLPPSILLQLENEKKGVEDVLCLPEKVTSCPSCSQTITSHRTMKGEEKEILAELCKFIKRAYEQNLITTSSGSFSHRLEMYHESPGLSFVITPTDSDRGALLPSDLCFLSDQIPCSCSTKKRNYDGTSKDLIYHSIHPTESLYAVSPSRAAAVHSTIYKTHPEVKCIMITTPTFATTFCITGEKFNAAGIPESHIVLHNVETLSFDSLVRDEGLTIAKALNPAKGKTTVMVEGYGLITVGSNLLKTFVQLEVCESMCGVNITAMSRGKVDLLTSEQIKEIDCVFQTH